MRGMIFGLVLLGLLGGAGAAWAETPLEIGYGANAVDVNGDGVEDVIVRVRWQTWSAHSFDHYLIAMHLKDHWHDESFYEVPKGSEGGPDYVFRTNEGADCLRVGYRFWLDEKGFLGMERYSLTEGKDAYCEAQIATVTRYRLVDAEQEEGEQAAVTTPFYLKEVSKKTLKGKYESVEGLMKGAGR